MHRRRRIARLYSRTRCASLARRLALVGGLAIFALSPIVANADASVEEHWTKLEESFLRRVQDAATDLQEPLSTSERFAFLTPFKHLWDGDEPHRRSIRTLTGSGLPAAAFALVGVAGDPEFPFRREAVAGLGMSQHWIAIPALLRALDDPAPDVRIAAISSLTLMARAKTLQSKRNAVGARLIETAKSDSDDRVRGTATTALPSFGGRGFTAFLAAVNRPPTSITEACRRIRLRAFFGQRSSLANRRRLARDLAAEVGVPTASHLSRARSLGDYLASDGLMPCTDPRSETIRWLGLLRIRASGPLLVRIATEDADPAIRAAAVSALGAFGGDVAEATIVAALDDPNLEVRSHAVSAFDDLPEERKTAFADELAARLVEDESTVLRRRVATASEELPGDWSALVPALADPSVIVRRAAEASLLERAEPEEMAHLIDALEADARLSIRAARILAAWPDETATDVLVDTLESGSTEARAMAALALGLRGDGTARIALEDCAKRPPQGAAIACIQALQDLDQPASLDVLRRLADEGADSNLRDHARNAHDLIARAVGSMDTEPNDGARRAGGAR